MLKIFGEFDDAPPDRIQFRRELFEFSEQVKGVLLREMDVQFLHDLVVIRPHSTELRVELRQLGDIIQRSLV